MDIAERHRLSIDRWFYRCSHEMHRGLASMYEADDRFRHYIDKHGEDLTAFLARRFAQTRHAMKTEFRRVHCDPRLRHDVMQLTNSLDRVVRGAGAAVAASLDADPEWLAAR